MRARGWGPNNPPTDSAKPYDEVSKSTNYLVIANHNDRNYHIFALHCISFASITTGGLCLYQLLRLIFLFCLSPRNFISNHANPTAEML